MRTAKVAVVALALASLLACVSGGGVSTAQSQWIANRDRQPLSFVVPAADADAAWQRAQTWVAQWGEMPITIANETVIQTQQPQDTDATIGIVVTRSKAASGDWQFRVDSKIANPFSIQRSIRMAQALAYFTASGIPYPD